MWSTVLCVLVLSEQTGMKSQNLWKFNWWGTKAGTGREGVRSTTVLDILTISSLKERYLWCCLEFNPLWKVSPCKLGKVLRPSWRQQGSVSGLFQGGSSRGFLWDPALGNGNLLGDPNNVLQDISGLCPHMSAQVQSGFWAQGVLKHPGPLRMNLWGRAEEGTFYRDFQTFWKLLCVTSSLCSVINPFPWHRISLEFSSWLLWDGI